jgi:hypothetical protein
VYPPPPSPTDRSRSCFWNTGFSSSFRIPHDGQSKKNKSFQVLYTRSLSNQREVNFLSYTHTHTHTHTKTSVCSTHDIYYPFQNDDENERCGSFTVLTARMTQKCSCAFSWWRILRTSVPSGSWSKYNSITCKNVYIECNANTHQVTELFFWKYMTLIKCKD